MPGPGWRRNMRCDCDLTRYRTEEEALAAAGSRDLPPGVVPVYRCTGSTAWHVSDPEGLPPLVLESTGRRLAYELLTNNTVNFSTFRAEILGINMAEEKKRWITARKRYCRPMVDAGIVTEGARPDGHPDNQLRLADPAAANRIVQIGLEAFLSERGLPDRSRG